MDPQQKDLFDTLVANVRAGKWMELGIYILLLYFPAIVAWFSSWLKDRKIEKQYEERLSDRKAEIDRQATRIKDLENVLLTTKRK